MQSATTTFTATTTVLILLTQPGAVSGAHRLKVRVDLLVVLQISERFTVDDLTKVGEGISSFSDRLEMSENHVNIALVNFGHSANVVSNFTDDAGRFKRAMTALTAGNAGRSSHEALKTAEQLLLRTGRPFVPKMIVLILNGLPSQPNETVAIARKLRKQKTFVYCIGVDDGNVQQTFDDHLLAVAGDLSDQWRFQNFEEFETHFLERVVQTIKRFACMEYFAACKFQDILQKDCVPIWWRRTNANFCQKLPFALPACKPGACHRICDRLWPWTGETVCNCSSPVYRSGPLRFPELLTNCPRRKPCSGCTVPTGDPPEAYPQTTDSTSGQRSDQWSSSSSSVGMGGASKNAENCWIFFENMPSWWWAISASVLALIAVVVTVGLLTARKKRKTDSPSDETSRRSRSERDSVSGRKPVRKLSKKSDRKSRMSGGKKKSRLSISDMTGDSFLDQSVQVSIDDEDGLQKSQRLIDSSKRRLSGQSG